MYFPAGFDTDQAIELGELICQAYDQFEAFENDRAWKLTGGYALKERIELPLVCRTHAGQGEKQFRT